MNNHYVQKRLTQRLTHILAKKTGSIVHVGDIRFSAFSRLMLEDVFISDTHNDTLLYIKKLRTNIEGINLSSNNFRLKDLELEEPYIKLISYNDNAMNLFTFLEALEGQEIKDSLALPSSYFFTSAKTKIKDGRFVYLDFKREKQDFGMNYDDLDFHNINVNIKNLHTAGSAIKMTLDSLHCKEKSGLDIQKGSTKLIIDDGLLRLENTSIALLKSELNAAYLNFSYVPGTKAWSKFTNAVMLDYLLDSTRIKLNEIALFNENLKSYEQTLTISGHITGTVQNMRCEDVIVTTYSQTKFRGNLSMNGLPNIDETFFDANILDFQTSLSDIEQVKIPNYEKGYLSFPKSLKKLGVFTYKGKYTGFVSDFVFYGQFFSTYGNIKTDISVKPSTRTQQLELSGKIIMNNFKIGDLVSNKMLGKVSLNVDVLNAMANENYNSYAKIKGKINQLEILNYPYENIHIDGYFANKVFDGKFNMDDENIAFDFTGNVDVHEEVPKTNFTLKLAHAKLFPLHLNKLSQDSMAQVSFSIQSHLDGGSIDAAAGDFTIYDLHYLNSKGQLATDTISIKSSLKNNLRTLHLKSDFLEASLDGDFKISELRTLPQRLISKYVNISLLNGEATKIRQEKVKLSVDLKKLNPIIYLFTDNYRISNNAKLTASYATKTDDSHNLQVKFNAGLLKIQDYIFQKVSLNTKGAKDLKTKLTIDRSQLARHLDLRWFSIQNQLTNSEMHTTIDWGDKEKLPYSGTFSFHSIFQEIANKQIAIKNTLIPTNFHLDNKDWQLHESEIIIDSTDINIKNFKISNEKQHLGINGFWSADKSDSLRLNLHTFEIAHIWNILGPKNVKLSGKMSGYARYESIAGSHAFESDLQLPQLTVDNKNLGAIAIHSEWKHAKRALYSQASLHNYNQDLIDISGYYKLANNSLDYKLNFNNFDLELVKDFTKEYLNNLEGSMHGELQVSGNTKKPLINGNLNIDIPRITIAETGVNYHLKEKIQINDSRVLFQDFKLLDEKNQTAIINGEILTGIGTNSNIDLKIAAQNIRVLEDSYQPLAYGNAKVSADLEVTGNFEHVKIRGDIDTENNSKIIVPFDSASEVGDNNFITFINPSDSTEYEINNDILFIPTSSKSPLTFDVDFSINPTSEIQVLFESKSGSVLKSRGTANLLVSKNQEGKQTIMGEYKVSQGTFFYSLESIVNKKFILQEGGTISWNGAPEKAYVNLRAIYQVKASIAPLLYQEPENSKLRQTTVLCKTYISGQLEDPKLTFEIEFPNLDSTTEGNVKAALQTTDLTKQVLSLLVFNRFTTPEYTPNAERANNGDALSVTTSELLSSKISSILSQLSKEVNIGFIYRPGDELTKEELGLAVSTELLKNRVVISGNLGFSSQDDNNRFNDFTGDVDFDIKLNKRGNLRLRAFSHAQDNLYYYENKRNIQGAGIIYNEEFDTFRELIELYKEKLGWGKKKHKK